MIRKGNRIFLGYQETWGGALNTTGLCPFCLTPTWWTGEGSYGDRVDYLGRTHLHCRDDFQ